MFAPSVAFVDLETTGTSPGADRVTEVGIVRVDDGDRVSEWSTLVDPERSIPPGVQALTGITNAMVAAAPAFGRIADDIAGWLAGCVFVAHNARFDYGFLKREFGRLGRAFSARVVCTVKLSRRLYPGAGRHNLDALIDRHGLPAADRHRALGDARVLLAFLRALYREWAPDVVDAIVARMLRTPSLPPQLAADALERIPEAPGVYRFYGLNPLPLYIGKSVNLRDRVTAHFSADYRSANDLRLSSEITRIEVEETAGELGALLREAQLVKALLPAYNQRLRRRNEMVALRVAAEPAPPDYVPSDAVDPAALDNLYGPFASRRGAREALRAAAARHALCWTALGLERRSGPCFARQIDRCAGRCVGAETPAEHHARLRMALEPHALRPWPYPGPVAVRETSLLRERTDVHLFRDWCWLGTAHDEGDLEELISEPPRPAFDLDVYRVLARRLPRMRSPAIVAVGTESEAGRRTIL
ncbi:MAG TPA: exonuclease domain-containing protein [Casimicrobiaceae bacterium]|nr:exonuclease domain-containing protein [Casimicrobiaceae bacterium]